jgi:nucleoside phosphorylase
MHWSDSIDTNPDWTARLSEAATKGALQAEKGNLAHSDPPAISPADKRSLHIQTKALGVDMESFAVGEAARARGVPFQMMRVVADGATRILPVSALDAMNPDGSVSTVRTLATLALRPWELGDLVRLGLQTAAARRTLRDLAFLGAPRLFFM